MLPQSTKLADDIANLRITATVNSGPSLLPAALQTLIIAILTRLFTRLEDMIRLWQTGQLPIPPARPERHQSRTETVCGHERARRSSASFTRPRRTAWAPTPANCRAGTEPPRSSRAPSRTARALHPIPRPAAAASLPAVTPCTRPRSARAPPPDPVTAPCLRSRPTAPNLFRKRNNNLQTALMY